MSGVGGVWLERSGASLLLMASTFGTWWLSQQAVAVAQRTSVREEQLEHLATLVVPRVPANAGDRPSLQSLDDLFEGQRLFWVDTGRGHVLSLRAADGAEEGR